MSTGDSVSSLPTGYHTFQAACERLTFMQDIVSKVVILITQQPAWAAHSTSLDEAVNELPQQTCRP